jgi:hypothetical protein
MWETAGTDGGDDSGETVAVDVSSRHPPAVSQAEEGGLSADRTAAALGLQRLDADCGKGRVSLESVQRGALLLRGREGARIVSTEAKRGKDPAEHRWSNLAKV